MKFNTEDKYLAGSLLCFKDFKLQEVKNNEFIINCKDKRKLALLLEQYLNNDLCVDFIKLNEQIQMLENKLNN